MSGGSRRAAWLWPPRPVVADGLLAVGLAGLSVSSAVSDRARGGHVPTASLVLLGALAPALWPRRRFPGTSLLAVAAIQVGLLAMRTQPSANYLAELVAPYSVALYGSRRVRLATAVGAGVALIVMAVPGGGSAWGWEQALGLLFGGAGAWILGTVLRTRRARVTDLENRAARLERERELEARRAVAEERLRIARELHDVVAHNLSVVVVQAQAVQRLLDRDVERAREVVASIEGTGREALDEMRQLLGVLRDSPDGADGPDGPFGPQPGLEQLAELLDQVRAAGLPVTLRVEGRARRLPAAVDLSAYRIVQEALTNALKHAGQARADVVVRYGEGELDVRVADDGRGAAAGIDSARLPGSGHGLVGMRERVALFGGELAIGPRPGGGFEVRARLPLGGVRA